MNKKQRELEIMETDMHRSEDENLEEFREDCGLN